MIPLVFHTPHQPRPLMTRKICLRGKVRYLFYSKQHGDFKNVDVNLVWTSNGTLNREKNLQFF